MEPAKPSRILAADDSPRDLELLTEILVRGGYQLILAREGSEALAIAAREKPDLILLDILMPGINGIELCKRLKADPVTQATPVIFVTGLSELDQVLAGFEVGAVDYVTKPFRIPELMARVNVHVELRRAQQEVRTLRGILPTCAHCKKIRDEKGSWQAIESYISQHSEAHFSHGLCPDCLPFFFPEASKPTAGPG